jgi:hypothetical protein
MTVRVTFLGAHGFRDLPQALGFVIQTGETTLLVECGQYVDLALARVGIASEAVDGLYISHNHVDHAAGVEPFVVTQAMKRFLSGSKHADHDVALIVDSGVDIGALDDLKRTYPLLTGPGMSGIRTSDVRLTAKCVQWRDLRLATFPLSHAVPSAGLIVQNASRTIVWWADGIDATEGESLNRIDQADLLVASVLGSERYSGLAAQFKFLTASGAATIASQLSSQLAVVHHFYVDDEADIVSDAAAVGMPNVIFGRLGESIEL